ncbi:probable cytochrome P450 9f2 isoform X2 [Ostrinia nubilalis]|uniref:probable cytochrome P450 9f2 isoform X2 n=1 Tax=Ostrinia nubilalis TaxID=29057 RepID=UPI0030824FE7
MLIEILIFVVTFLVAYVTWKQKKVHDFLRERDVKFVPGYPLFGNTYGSLMDKKHIVDELIEAYNKFPEERYVGFLEGSNPVIIIRDPEIIKNITVKNFEHFMNHKEFFPSNEDIFGKSVFVMKGEVWRDMRATLSPAFTGSKMRLMVPAMIKVSNNVVNYLKETEGEIVDVDDLMRRYANDVIAAAGYGLEVNSFVDKTNEFYNIGQTLFQFDLKQKLILFLFMHCPSLTEKLNMTLFPPKTVNFFRHIVTKTMEDREKNKIERPDMIQLLMEANKGTLKPTQTHEENDVGFAAVEEVLKTEGDVRKWSLDDLVGQVFIFFTAGFETSASTLVMCIHELALNPKAQDKLHEEVLQFSQTKKLTYENIPAMKYLDCVLNETLRKWSAAIFMDRTCVKHYELPPPREGGKPYLLKPGDVVYNMVNAIHMDPKYFPEPEAFIPERFSDENKHNIEPFTFMPFGMGPRACIASRFALLELKVLMYFLVLNFKFLKCEKTMDPIRLINKGFLIQAAEGTFIKFESRM